MRYIGEFTAIDGHEYKVTISTGRTAPVETPTQITLGASPFVTSMSGEDDTIYKPAKYSAGSVGIITGDYMFDIYSSTAQGTKVVLSDAGGTVWTGYATPNLYDMGFVHDREEISIECIDALSTLQYVKYLPETKQVRSLADVLKYVVQQCNAYKAIFVSANTTLPGKTTPILSDLYISDENFFATREAKESDEDVAWTCQDVLEEICRFLGVTAVAVGDTVWLVDYDALKAGNPTYSVISLDGLTHSVPIIAARHITGADYAGADARISLDNVYNKVTVTADLYTFDDLLPDIFNDAELTNITSAATPTVNVGNRGFKNVAFVHQGKSGNLETLIDTGAVGRKKDTSFFVANQYVKSPYVATVPAKTTVGWDDVQTMYGCVLKKEFVKELSKDFCETVAAMSAEEYVKWASSEVSHLSFTKSIQFCIRGNSAPTLYAAGPNASSTAYDAHYSSYPLLTINVDKPGRLYGGANAYILITGNVVLSHNDNDAYAKTSFEFSGDYRSTIWGKWEYIYCRLKWGGRWWNGSAWQSSACDFKLYFDTPDNKKMKNKLYQSLPLRNTVKWWAGIDKDGYAIPVPEGVVLNDEMVFTMYSPAQQYDDAYTNSGQGDGRSYWIWIKDFGMEAVIANPDYTGAADTDTVYTNVINSAYVNELDEIKFKICTWDGKKPNYSSVVRRSGDGYYYADTTYNAACAAGEAQWRGVSGSTSLRQEEHLIYRLVNQYATPSVILTLPLHGGLHPAGTFTDKTITNRIFIIDSYSMDYKANQQTVRLIEKK